MTEKHCIESSQWIIIRFHQSVARCMYIFIVFYWLTRGNLLCLNGGYRPFVKKHGFNVIQSFIGHGIGAEFHTAPDVLHHGMFIHISIDA